jgi:hypothetical protein
MPETPNDPTLPNQSDTSDASIGSLDFERADKVSHSASACAQCATPITDRYFTLGSHVLCESCHLAFQNAKAPGNAASRLFGAAALGTGAAAIGCALWMLVTELTGYEIGLIAIAVGYLVGMAVHVGARRMGGVAYQLLAVFLTYSAIVMTYVPMIADQFMAAEGVRHEVQTDPSDDSPTTPSGDSQVTLSDDSQTALSDDSQTNPSSDSQTALSDEWAGDDTANSASGAGAGAGEGAGIHLTEPGMDELTAWIAAIPVAYVLPFLMGFENAIGILIIGIALWQAFRMNARAKIDLQGPFRLEVRDGALG